MTWTAHQLLADATPAVLGRLRALPGFAAGLHVLRGIPDVPAGGLAVVRELGPGGTQVRGQPVIDWSLPPLVDAPTEPLHDRAVVADDLAPRSSLVPPRALLDHGRALADATGARVAYLAHHMWAGATDGFAAWIWGPAGTTCVRFAVEADADGARIAGVRTHDRGGARFAPHVDPLARVLAAFDVTLDGGYWAPHTRAFAWAAHRDAGR